MPAKYVALRGEVLDVLRTFPANTFDAVLTDPPYGLGSREPALPELIAYLQGSEANTGGDFMGKKWNVPSVATWGEIVRVLKPGAPVLSFAAARTAYLITLGMRAGGLEIYDTLAWMFARSMPKPATQTDKYIDAHLKVERPVVGSRQLSGNAAVSTADKGGTFGVQVGTAPAKTIAVTRAGCDESRLWEGYGHALAGGYEPVMLGCKPYDKSIAHNVLTHGTGALNVRDCRIGSSGGTRKIGEGAGDAESVYGDGLNGGTVEQIEGLGRWPKNVVFSHSEDCVCLGTTEGPGFARNRHADGAHPFGGAAGSEYTSEHVAEQNEVWQCAPGCPVGELDAQSGMSKSQPFRENVAEGAVLPLTGRSAGGYSDSGGASRFFYCAKVSKAERERGCEDLPLRSAAECTGRKEGLVGSDRPQAGAGRSSGARNHHPNLKPIKLTTYLANLIKPPTAAPLILVPYAGSGSEMIGAILAGWGAVVGIERDPTYLEILAARLREWCPDAERIEP